MIEKTDVWVLVADDSITVAKGLEFCLKRAGFSVEVARNGREAWEMAREKQYDVVVTDEQMSLMTGRQLCRHLRNDDRYRLTPIILLTGKAFELDADELSDDLQISVTFGKPFSPELLAQTIETLTTTEDVTGDVASLSVGDRDAATHEGTRGLQYPVETPGEGRVREYSR